MRSFSRTFRVTALFLLAWMSVLHVAPAAAGLVPSQPSGMTAVASSRDADVLAVQRALEHEVVAQKLKDYGVTPEQVEARMASMTDAELHSLATATQGLPSGGDSLGVLVTILVIILLVILILKLMNRDVVIR
jgi:hypothetical protein